MFSSDKIGQLHRVFDAVGSIDNIENALTYLHGKISKNTQIENAIALAVDAHKGQYRKSGEPYVIHPILVASIVAVVSGDKAMVAAALLHDVVEDTSITIDVIKDKFGKDIAHLVNGLTKIQAIRDEKLLPSNSNEKLITSALTFRKMLIASIEDVRILVIKLCDRAHNMLTLDSLPQKKQLRISEETLVVYAPIAHRLGISSIKNRLEDLSFKYIFPQEYADIESYLATNYHSIQLKLNNLIEKIKKMMISSGYEDGEFVIFSRIKHDYSIYLKMQRKGVSIDEVLDLLAIRILVNEPLDCYKVLGLVHLNFKPLSARFKDYVALAKENGYQTLHTTIFEDTAIFELQIRTFNMHKTAELGVAAHWKYKGEDTLVNLDWLNNLNFQNESIEEYYELVKSDLYSEDVVTYTPHADRITLPRGAVALDFAYAIHSEIGNRAKEAYVNKQKATLLTQLKNGDMVEIKTANQEITRCTWIDTVKTARAKNFIRIGCNHRIKFIDTESSFSILGTILGLNRSRIMRRLNSLNLLGSVSRVTNDPSFLKEVIVKYINELKKVDRFRSFLRRHRFKIKKYSFGSIDIYSNHYIGSIQFDYCCHPKSGDEIVAFKIGNRTQIHHKMCVKASKMIDEHSDMVSVSWNTVRKFDYRLIISLLNEKGALANMLHYLAKLDIDITSIELGKGQLDTTQYCEVEMQTGESDIKKLQKQIEKKHKVIQFVSRDDVYKK